MDDSLSVISVLGSDLQRCFRLGSHVVGNHIQLVNFPQDDAFNVWVGEDQPQQNCQVWCRTSKKLTFWDEVNTANEERVANGLDAVCVHDTPTSSRLPLAHILVEGPGAVMVYSSEADLHRYLVWRACQHENLL